MLPHWILYDVRPKCQAPHELIGGRQKGEKLYYNNFIGDYDIEIIPTIPNMLKLCISFLYIYKKKNTAIISLSNLFW